MIVNIVKYDIADSMFEDTTNSLAVEETVNNNNIEGTGVLQQFFIISITIALSKRSI